MSSVLERMVRRAREPLSRVEPLSPAPVVSSPVESDASGREELTPRLHPARPSSARPSANLSPLEASDGSHAPGAREVAAGRGLARRPGLPAETTNEPETESLRRQRWEVTRGEPAPASVTPSAAQPLRPALLTETPAESDTEPPRRQRRDVAPGEPAPAPAPRSPSPEQPLRPALLTETPAESETEPPPRRRRDAAPGEPAPASPRPGQSSRDNRAPAEAAAHLEAIPSAAPAKSLSRAVGVPVAASLEAPTVPDVLLPPRPPDLTALARIMGRTVSSPSDGRITPGRQPAAPPTPPADVSNSTEVTISIGSIEVRAAPAPASQHVAPGAASSRQAPFRPAVSLDDFLARSRRPRR